MRAGLVVAISIPLVLAVTFVILYVWGISLQRISLGALIIALGLLVDDAMITVEMMVARLEAGESKASAATFAYTSTAFPMLTGTLVTIAGFLPIGFNASAAGEYTFSLFVVIAIALLISWIVAVLFAPLIGVAMLPSTLRQHDARPRRLMGLFRTMLDRRHALALDHDRHDAGCARSCGCRCALRATTVLSILRSARNPGRHDVAADQFDR